MVVWLDDLEQFLGPDGLTLGLLSRLASGKAILVATIRSQAREAPTGLATSLDLPSGRCSKR